MSARVTQLENRLNSLDKFIETLIPLTWSDNYWKAVRNHIFKMWMREMNKR
tara:strand:- start:289 stop:441 length:153 start_codon:yes stop_codon:yes gene_type:complete